MTQTILHAIEESPATIMDLAIELDMPRKSVAARISDLRRKGMIHSWGKIPAPGRGRPATIWTVGE